MRELKERVTEIISETLFVVRKCPIQSFLVSRVLQGLFKLSSELFGIEIKVNMIKFVNIDSLI